MESYQKGDQYDVSKPLSTVEYCSEFSRFLQENLYDHSKKSKVMRLAQLMGVDLERCKERSSRRQVFGTQEMHPLLQE